VIDHREKSFEAAVEQALVTTGGYQSGDPAGFNCARAIHAEHVLAFVKATQEKEWGILADYYGSRAEAAFINELVKGLDAKGTLDVLRHGIDFFGQTFKFAYFAPASGLNPESRKQYAANRLTVTRQVHFSDKDEQSVDLLLSVNGIPTATAELKNSFSGQNVRHAIQQYRDRDSRVPLFQFKRRALVHFAVDPNEIHMTTRLAGEHTRFLPFNRGHNHGAGNPPNPDGYATAYLWEEVWKRDSWLDLLGRFLHIETVEKKTTTGRRSHTKI
jgi:type I restriction enzyme R subunit